MDCINEVNNKIKIKVIIYGINNFSSSIQNFLYKYIEVVGYTDDDITKSNQLIDKKHPIILEKNLFDYSYDYIIIQDNYSEQVISRLVKNGVPSEKLVDFYHCINQYIKVYNDLYFKRYFYSYLYSRIKKINDNCEVVATGLSYVIHGIVEDQFKNSCLKLTLPSQDLYYDYIIMKNILNIKNSIKYCIIGITYYSFDFDLSFSSEGHRILEVYYPIFQDSHHLALPENYSVNPGIEAIPTLINNSIDLFFSKDIYNYVIEHLLKINLSPEYDDRLWNKEGFLRGIPIENLKEQERISLGRERAASHNKLNYPNTQQEYKNILNKYLDLLNEFNIKAIMVVFPTTKYYYENFDPNTEYRFYSIINELKKNYNFQLIDMFRSEEFEYNDFLDWDHLNKKGATKMTQTLNNLIEW